MSTRPSSRISLDHLLDQCVSMRCEVCHAQALSSELSLDTPSQILVATDQQWFQAR